MRKVLLKTLTILFILFFAYFLEVINVAYHCKYPSPYSIINGIAVLELTNKDMVVLSRTKSENLPKFIAIKRGNEDKFIEYIESLGVELKEKTSYKYDFEEYAFTITEYGNYVFYSITNTVSDGYIKGFFFF